MTAIEKATLAEIDNEPTMTGERIRSSALERVAYLAERGWLPQVRVSLGEEPQEIHASTGDGLVGFTFAQQDGSIRGLYLLETNTDHSMRGSSLILSMGGLYRCASYATSRGLTGRKRIPHWQTRWEVPPQAWIKHRETIVQGLDQAEQRGRTASY